MSADAPKVCIVTPDFPPALGGVQTMLGRVASGLARGWEVTVIAPMQDLSRTHDERHAARVVRTRARWGGRRSAAVLAEMTRLVRRSGADVVLAGHPVALPAALARRGRAPVAVYLHGSELWSPGVARMLGQVGSRCRLALSNSRFTAEEARRAGVPANRIRIASPGADVPAVPDDAPGRIGALGIDGPFLLSLSRLVEPHKGQDLCIRAMPAIRARAPGVRYVVAGDGPLRPYLEGLARAVDADDTVQFVGAVDEETKAALLAHCRALVMVSREARGAGQFEGWGIAYVEAALLGRPAIAGAAGGAPEVVDDGITGLVVEPTSITAVVDAALELLEKPRRADELGRAALERAERERVWPVALGHMDALLRELL